MVINKKATRNPKNLDKKCFQYTMPVTLNHKKRSTINKKF